MNGDHVKVPLKLPNKKGRHWSFMIRVSISSHVEGNPLFDCKEYNPLHTYGDCIQEELENIFEKKLKCIPPMLARDTDNMCNARYNISKDEGREIFELFWNNYRYFEPSLCKTPCTQTKYEIFLNS